MEPTEPRLTVRQLARLAGVSPRTLHYYDQIGLLKPSRVAANGYRSYDSAAVLQLQQILFFRELGLRLEDIKDILHQPDFDPIAALQTHRAALAERAARLERLIHTIDQTLQHLQAGDSLSPKQLFAGFSPAEEQRRTEQAIERWGETAAESARKWSAYTSAQKQQIFDEGNAIYQDMAALIQAGAAPADAAVQAVTRRWEQHLRYFYTPTPEILLGLGDLYNDSPEFAANFEKFHPQLADFMRRAIQVYVANQA